MAKHFGAFHYQTGAGSLPFPCNRLKVQRHMGEWQDGIGWRGYPLQPQIQG